MIEKQLIELKEGLKAKLEDPEMIESMLIYEFEKALVELPRAHVIEIINSINISVNMTLTFEEELLLIEIVKLFSMIILKIYLKYGLCSTISYSKKINIKI